MIEQQENLKEPEFDLNDSEKIKNWMMWAKEERVWVEKRVGALNNKIKALQAKQKFMDQKMYQLVCDLKLDEKPIYTNEAQRQAATAKRLKSDKEYQELIAEENASMQQLYQSKADIEGIKTGMKAIEMYVLLKQTERRE